MKNDPIPEHIFGNMWAQTWGSLYDIAVPFPNAGARPDATPTIKDLTAEKMFDYADEFFVSLGMTPMTKLFWRNSGWVLNLSENISWFLSNQLNNTLHSHKIKFYYQNFDF